MPLLIVEGGLSVDNAVWIGVGVFSAYYLSLVFVSSGQKTKQQTQNAGAIDMMDMW